ncbi:hypothetical protein, partial [Streptomyces anulatus]
ARLWEGEARLGASEARLWEGEARLGASEARLWEGEARLGASEARLWEGEARLGASEARLQKRGWWCPTPGERGSRRASSGRRASPVHAPALALTLSSRFVGGELLNEIWGDQVVSVA